MWTRHAWQARIESLWLERSVLWLMGVRRVGKTSLAQSLPEIEYFDCELPRIRRELADPETFLEGMRGKRVVIDEIHRLADPAELLKIAADHFPDLRVLATGSSTLGASARFRDTLTGRKRELWLTPMALDDLDDFEHPDLDHRFLFGGLPPFFLAKTQPERDFQEWVDAYWAKDILELFRLERRQSFQKFFELLMVQSGGQFQASSFTGPCEVSHTTIGNYLAVLEATFVVHVVRPFSEHKAREIVAAPKVYGFDTGFVCYHRGWTSLRSTDRGSLFEHFVLNELHARLQSREIRYWRTKNAREVDFVLARRGQPPLAIECEWSADALDPASLIAFRSFYPDGKNLVVAADVPRPFTRKYGPVTVRFTGLRGLVSEVASER